MSLKRPSQSIVPLQVISYSDIVHLKYKHTSGHSANKSAQKSNGPKHDDSGTESKITKQIKSNTDEERRMFLAALYKARQERLAIHGT
jgi:hypothetical protein